MPQADTLDAAQVAALVRAQFPDLFPAAVDYLGEGYDSIAFDIGSRWVFRFPKRDDVEQQLLLELRALPVLAAHSPLPLPDFRFHGRPATAFPRNFAGYEKLAGVPAIGIDPAVAPFGAWAPVLARFLSWLHAFPVDEALQWSIPELDVASLVDEVRAEALDDFELLNRVAPNAPLEEWRIALMNGPAAPAYAASPPVLVHADLAAEHVLCDPATHTLTGVIDWSEIALGDRAIDLAGLFHWGGPQFGRAVLSRYSDACDTVILSRARYLAACRGVADVAFGLETGRTLYVDAGLRALTLNL